MTFTLVTIGSPATPAFAAVANARVVSSVTGSDRRRPAAGWINRLSTMRGIIA